MGLTNVMLIKQGHNFASPLGRNEECQSYGVVPPKLIDLEIWITKSVITNKGWHMNIINIGQSIFECHDVIPNDVTIRS
jgi:hypothetical protein